jgi:hypothetical protein
VHTIRRLFHSFMLMVGTYYVGTYYGWNLLRVTWIGMRLQHWDLVLKDGKTRHNSYMVIFQPVHMKIFLERHMF